MLVQKDDFEMQKQYFLPRLLASIFIHPTDAHYGIGCDATNTKLCMKLRLIKKWQTQPLPIIAPSKQWIRENLEIPEEGILQLPGPVTLIAHMKNPNCVCEEIHHGTHTLIVRMPDHWISEIAKELNKPIVSTCANKRAQLLMMSLETADPQLVDAADYVLYEGPKKGQPTLFINYTQHRDILP